MKKIFLYAITLLLFAPLKAQQLSQISQYMVNDFVYNPAIAGAKEEVVIVSNLRRQWMGYKNAPVTQTIFAHGYTGKTLGLGVSFYNDVAGPTRRTGLNVSMAKHISINDNTSLSLGLAGLLFQYYIDPEKLQFDEANDPVVDNFDNSVLTPDANFGTYLYSDVYYIGFSIMHLTQNKVNMFDIEQLNENQVKRQYILTLEYDFTVSDDITFEPSFLAKYVNGAPPQVDITLKGHYDFSHGSGYRPRRAREATTNKNLWLGVSYRTTDAVVGILGINYDLFHFSYSYDFLVAKDIQDFASSTHEFTLGLSLQNAISKDDDMGKKGGRRRYY